MKLPGRRRAVRRLSGALVCAALTLLYGVGPVAAQSIVFGTPSATSKFGVNIVFQQPYSGATVKSASVLVQQPGDVGASPHPQTGQVVAPGSGRPVGVTTDQ